jgi:hypothetical protein
VSYQADKATTAERELELQRKTSLEVYQAFMVGYVRRINEATLGVTIGGVRIGEAKYSRLAQINLKSRIITFSRYAIENVPERGRRYLVIHELAHVKEPNHNSRFWQLVERYEPNYKAISKALELAFKRNVKEEQLDNVKVLNPLSGRMERPKLLFLPELDGIASAGMPDPTTAEDDDAQNDFLCTQDEFGDWQSNAGIIHGGSELDLGIAL